MPGSNNFLQWNPSAVNQETDAAYTADTMRVNGAANPAIFPSGTANKVLYQVTTFVAALAQALAAKGYALNDASLSTLAGVLANVVTATDLAAALALYAPLNSPALAGTPSAPTPATGDNSAKLATTAFIKSQGYLAAITGAMVVAALGFTPVQQGGGANQAGNKLFLGWDPTTFKLRVQVDATDVGDLALESDLAAFPLRTEFGNLLATSGYQHLTGGLILQWGVSGISGSGNAITFPIAFPTRCFLITSNDIGGSGTSSVHSTACVITSASGFSAFAKDVGTNAAASTNLGWLAIGY